jgi:hypothetical protein
VARLKGLTIDIGNEVREQNSLLDDMGDGFSGVSNLLGTSLKRIGTMLESGGSKHMCYLRLLCGGCHGITVLGKCRALITGLLIKNTTLQPVICTSRILTKSMLRHAVLSSYSSFRRHHGYVICSCANQRCCCMLPFCRRSCSSRDRVGRAKQQYIPCTSTLIFPWKVPRGHRPVSL